MLFVLFVAIPIVEIIATVVVAHFIGWGLALLALLALSLVGGWQVKVQGLGAWRDAVSEVDRGGSPALVALDGALRVIGAVLLTLPGFLTAFIGIVLLLGPPRRVAARRAGGWLVNWLRPSFVVVSERSGTFRRDGTGEVVDVEGWEESPQNPGPSGRPALGRHGG